MDTHPKRSSKQIVRSWVRSIAPFLVVMVGMYWVDSKLTADAQLQEGIAAPELKVTALRAGQTHAQPFDISQRPNSDVVVLNFWASWCPPCIAEIPALNKVASEDPNVELVGIAVDIKSPAQLPEWRDTFGIRYTVADATPELLTRYGVSMLPTTVVINRHNDVSKTLVGETTATALRAAIEIARSE